MSSQEDKTVCPIRFRFFEEISSRPKWRDDVDAVKHKPQRIIGDYSFSKQNQVHCGLKSCRSSHMNGYVIETVDGLETHIGNRCGSIYFGVTWGEVRSAFNRATEDRDRQEWLVDVLAQRETLLLISQSLLQNVIESSQEIRTIVERLKKESELYSSFTRVLRAGGIIQIEKSVDVETAKAMNLPLSQRHTFETIGRITSIEVLPNESAPFPGDQVASKLRTQAIPIFAQLSATALRNLNYRQRKNRAKDIENAKLILKDAEKYIASARLFLLPANLRQFGRLQISKMNQRSERILKQFCAMPDKPGSTIGFVDDTRQSEA